MGINSTGTAYDFGQLGSAFSNSENNTITAPEGMAIVAITFVTATELSSLVSKDLDRFPHISHASTAAHAGGTYTRTVDGATSSSQAVVFDQENAGTGNNDSVVVGDEIYIKSTGVSLGKVTAIDVGSNIKKITFSATATSLGDGIAITFVKPGLSGYLGAGGMAITTTDTFPAGLTIYGRWDTVSLNDAEGSLIAYFGQ
jgi:hypothetical protein